MAVKARFWVQKVTKQAVSGGELSREVTLQPVIRAGGLPGAEGNVDWSKYTPSGDMRLVVTAAGAGDWFEERIGKDVSITLDDPEDE